MPAPIHFLGPFLEPTRADAAVRLCEESGSYDCYRDEAERRTVAEHTDDLELDRILDSLMADLRARGQIDGPVPGDDELARLLIDSYIRFPEPAAA